MSAVATTPDQNVLTGNMAASSNVAAADLIAARIERLPISRWHTRVRVILGTATFFDAFDALTIAFVLPTLIGLWHLTPGQAGLLISTGFLGQLVGSIAFGWIGERYGRIFALNWSIIILSVFGLACAFAWNFWSLLIFRTVQGLGLGGEVPVAATYINEIAKAKERGRFVLLYQGVFAFGVVACSLSSIWLVPNLGWQSLFVIGAAPALLVLILRRTLPESPRWLARNGRLAEANQVMTQIETRVAATRRGQGPLPPVVPIPSSESQEKFSWLGLFKGIYLKRTLTVWLLWYCGTAVGFGLQTWLPTMFRTVYKLPVATALAYSAVGNIAVCITVIIVSFSIDRVGRKPILFTAFFVAAVSLVFLGAYQSQVSTEVIMYVAGISLAFVAISQLTLWVYVPETYPTRMRSVGSGTAAIWARVAGMLTPALIGFLLPNYGIEAVFYMLGGFALLGVLTVVFLVIETSGRTLEELSP